MTTAGVSTAGVSGPADLDEATLVVRASEGDLSSFQALVARYERRLFQLALRMMGNTADAEDIVQEVFVSTWRRLPELRDTAAFSAWMYRCTTNRCLSVLRRRRPPVPLDDHLPTLRAPDDPARAAQLTAELAALAEALQGLPANQRAVWLLREIHGRGYDEIAETLGIGPDAVRGRLARARVQLAELMSPWR